MADSQSIAIPSRVKDLTGRKCGRWTVLAFAGQKSLKAYWLCRCDCGTTRDVWGSAIVTGTSQSCGCLGRERTVARNTKHGKARTPEYRCWLGILARCYKPAQSGYSDYGGRGITVCRRWRESFAAFCEDMGPKPDGDDISIERKDNDKGYCKENCVWATRTQQARNRRSNRLLTFDGRTQCVAAWAEERGLHLKILWQRLNRGWSVERALGMPAAKR